MSSTDRLRRARLRILHLPNETSPDPELGQVGPRQALAQLVARGEAEAYEAYSYLQRRAAVGDDWQEEVLHVAAAFGPDLIVWQHAGDVDVRAGTVDRLLGLPSRPRLLYHEGDPHGRVFKRVPPATRLLFSRAHLSLVVGSGHFARVARRAGSPRVAAVVQPYDAERFGQPWQPTEDRELDAVMIGNLGGTRVPGMLLPGGRRRRRFAAEVCRSLGPDRFALYGSGWDGLACARGRTPFMQQTDAIRSAWISVNWDHFDREPGYASDRLAISLAAGVPHLTTRHPGYDRQYPDCPGLLLADSVDEAVDLLRWSLAQDRAQLLEWGAQARRYAEQHLEATVVWRRWIDLAVSELFGDRTGDARGR